MFLSEKPAESGTLVADAMANWKTFWIFPCLMALVVTIVFAVAFWDKYREENETESAD